MSFLKDDKQQFRLSDLNIIGNSDTLCKTIDFVNNKQPFGKIPLTVDATVTNQYYSKLYDDIKASLNRQPKGYIGVKSATELQEMLKPFTATVIYDEKSHMIVSRGNVSFGQPPNNLGDKPITSYPVVDFKWNSTDVKRDHKFITDTLTQAIVDKSKVTELITDNNIMGTYPLVVPTEPAINNQELLRQEYPLVYLGFISFGVYYPETPVVFQIDNTSENKNFSETINNICEGRNRDVVMPLLLAYNLPDGVYLYKLLHSTAFSFFMNGMCQKSIISYSDTREIIDYIDGQIIERIYDSIDYTLCDNRHIRCETASVHNANDITYYHEYDNNGQSHGITLEEQHGDSPMFILTFNHGKLDGPFELRNSTQDHDFLAIGTFGNFQGPEPKIYGVRSNNLDTLSPYIVGKLFVSLGNSRFITVYHFNEKHQLNGIFELVTNIEGYSREIPPNKGEMYSSNGIIILRRYYIEGRDVTPKEYDTYVTQLKEGIATIGNGKDVTSLISSYLL